MWKRAWCLIALVTMGSMAARAQEPVPVPTALRPVGPVGPVVPIEEPMIAGPLGWFNIEYQMLFPDVQNMPVLLRTAGGATLAGGTNGVGLTQGVRINSGVEIDGGQTVFQGILFYGFRKTVFDNEAAGIINVGPGTAVTNFSLRQWHQVGGAESNVLHRLSRMPNTRLYSLFGARYLSLDEDLTTRYSIGAVNFLDEFHSRNQFYGAQFGGILSHRVGNWDYELVAKCAIGVNYRQLFVLGSNSGLAPFQAFTQRSNIGFYDSAKFGAVPEVDATLRYYWSERCMTSFGYMFLTSINMTRPGEQISLAVPPLAPIPPRNSTYFLHGINFGFTLMY